MYLQTGQSLTAPKSSNEKKKKHKARTSRQKFKVHLSVFNHTHSQHKEINFPMLQLPQLPSVSRDAPLCHSTDATCTSVCRALQRSGGGKVREIHQIPIKIERFSALMYCAHQFVGEAMNPEVMT